MNLGNHPERYKPNAMEIQELIAAAKKHPLGTRFLIEGDLASVAITFSAHAFTVEAAREKLIAEDASFSEEN